MNKHKRKTSVLLIVITFAMMPLVAMAVPAMMGDAAMNVPLSVGVWPLSGLGSLLVLSLARVGSWRRDMQRLQKELDAEVQARYRAESALVEKEAFFRSVMDTNPNLIYVKDRDGRFAFVNQAAAEQFGAERAEDIIGRLEPEVAPDNPNIQRYRKEDLEIMNTLREKFTPEEATADPNGHPRWFQTVKRPLISEDGMSRYVLAVGTDITDRKHAEAQLVAERELLRVLMEHSPDSIYFKDCESRFVRCSQALCEKFGAAHEDIVGKTDFDFFSPAHAQAAFNDEREIMRTGQPLTGKVERSPMRDGTDVWALTAKMPLRDKSDKIIGTCGISKDITDMKASEARMELIHKQLLEASRLAGMAEVATNVLHNVGNVLNSVNVSAAVVHEKVLNFRINNLSRAASLLQSNSVNLAEFLLHDPRGKQLPEYFSKLATHLAEEQQAVLKEISMLNDNIEHIKEIVTMQQGYARVSGVMEPLKIEDLVEDAMRLNAGSMQRHQVTICREFEEVPLVATDKHKILQILVNLIRNAKQAMDERRPAEKRLTLRITASDEKHVHLSVIDNGVGISAENLTQIFTHGFTTRKDGHGFGLHSSAIAAQDLGGSLSVHSDGLGTGATFTLKLPCQPTQTSYE